MKIKTLVLFVVIVAALLNYGFTLVLGEEGREATAVKQVIKEYLDGFAKRDLDSMMKNISANYSALDANGDVIDYNEFKSRMEMVLKIFSGISNDNFKINKLNIRDNKAVMEIEFISKKSDLESNKRSVEKIGRVVYLAKEEGSWKIVRFQDKPKES